MPSLTAARHNNPTVAWEHRTRLQPYEIETLCDGSGAPSVARNGGFNSMKKATLSIPPLVGSGGAQGRIRTTDTRIFNPLLYQLSYLGLFARRENHGAAASRGASNARGL